MVPFPFLRESGDHYHEQHLHHYSQAAENGVGLIIVQSTRVEGVTREQGMWTPGSQAILRQITENARSNGAAIMIQLSIEPEQDKDINEWSTATVLEKQQELKEAAIKAAELGFDGVEYHFAHGFTLCQFMDAQANRRTDEFGGSLENRCRIVTDILPEVRERAGDDFIISARMGEFTPTSEDGIATARHLEQCGMDMLSVSFGMTMPEGPVPEGFEFSPTTHSGYVIKQAVTVPVIGANGIRTPEQAKGLVENGYADLTGLGRAMLADPRFAANLLHGTPYQRCISCKNCSWFKNTLRCPARKMAETA
jgi:2,4-dienoyl-CoA reductase-like NADH-dependent reductase (Old Yellow Enzyme family)